MDTVRTLWTSIDEYSEEINREKLKRDKAQTVNLDSGSCRGDRTGGRAMSSPHDESLILELDSPVATLERVGGKGASLARLAAAGLPVPPGFHITTLAYYRFVSENQLAESILTAAAQAKADDPATLDTASAQIQSLIAQGTIPDDIAALIRREYAALGGDDPPVAVRSSATAEDLPEMSFAGQQDTYLNVRGGDGVLEAVKRCWASLWTARALGYRARHGIRPEDVALAVVVQQLVPADVAGVLFTANPMTGSRDQVMINAAWGLGEAIVGGHVTPDTLTVDKPTGVIGSQEIADKDVMTVRSAGGTREEPVPADRRKQPALQPPQAAELTRLGVQIEQLYGMPMDVEWALLRRPPLHPSGAPDHRAARAARGARLAPAQPEGEIRARQRRRAAARPALAPVCHAGPPALERRVSRAAAGHRALGHVPRGVPADHQRLCLLRL